MDPISGCDNLTTGICASTARALNKCICLWFLPRKGCHRPSGHSSSAVTYTVIIQPSALLPWNPCSVARGTLLCRTGSSKTVLRLIFHVREGRWRSSRRSSTDREFPCRTSEGLWNRIISRREALTSGELQPAASPSDSKENKPFFLCMERDVGDSLGFSTKKPFRFQTLGLHFPPMKVI